MKIHVLLSLLGGMAAALAAQAARPADAAQPTADPARVFKAGAATSNITPAIGTPTVGGWAPVPSTHVHDDLHVRCLAQDRRHAPGPVQTGETLTA